MLTSETTPSPLPSKGRNVFRDMSNSVGRAASNFGGVLASWTTPTKPVAPETIVTPDAGVDIGDAETPTFETWQSADNFRFVEEEDDEVLFRVRDSGVLRSLALPCLPEAAQAAPGESIEDRQARVRAMRLSFVSEKPPGHPSLPSLSEVISKAVEASAADTASQSNAKPPPILTDEVWVELEEEMRRVSVGPGNFAEEGEEDDTDHNASFVSCHEDFHAAQETDVDNPSLPSMSEILLETAGADSMQDVCIDGSSAILEEDVIFQTLATAEHQEHGAAVVFDRVCEESEICITPVQGRMDENEEESMTVAKLCEMGFSPEEADWAVKQASTPLEDVVQPEGKALAADKESLTKTAVDKGNNMQLVEQVFPVDSKSDVEILVEDVVSEKKELLDTQEEAVSLDEEPPAEDCIQAVTCDMKEALRTAEEAVSLDEEPPAEDCIQAVTCDMEEALRTAEEAVSLDEEPPAEDCIQAVTCDTEEELPAEDCIQEVAVMDEEPFDERFIETDVFDKDADLNNVDKTAAEAATIGVRADEETVADQTSPVEQASAPAPASAVVCIRRAGCICTDCVEMETMFRKPTIANSPAKVSEDAVPVQDEWCTPVIPEEFVAFQQGHGAEIGEVTVTENGKVCDDGVNAEAGENILGTLVVESHMNTVPETSAEKGDGLPFSMGLRAERDIEISVHDTPSKEDSAPADEFASYKESGMTVSTEGSKGQSAVMAEESSAVDHRAESEIMEVNIAEVVAASASAVKEAVPALVTVCIRRAGCVCVDCLEMQAMFSKPAMVSSPVRMQEATDQAAHEAEAHAESPVFRSEVEQQGEALSEEEDVTEQATSPIMEEAAVEIEKECEVASGADAFPPSPMQVDVDVPIVELVVQDETPQHFLSNDGNHPAVEADVPETSSLVEEEIRHAVPAYISTSPPCKPLQAVAAVASGGPCIRRAGCTCADCTATEAMFGNTTMTNSPARPASEEDLIVAVVIVQPAHEAAVQQVSSALQKGSCATPQMVEAPEIESNGNQPSPYPASENTCKAEKCTRKAGCLCTDCLELSNLCSAPIVAAPKLKNKKPLKRAKILQPVSPSVKGASLAAKKVSSLAHEATTPTKTPQKKEETNLPVKFFVSSSPPCKPPQAASVVVASGGACIRRAGCTCADCALMAALFSEPSQANPLAKTEEKGDLEENALTENKAECNVQIVLLSAEISETFVPPVENSASPCRSEADLEVDTTVMEADTTCFIGQSSNVDESFMMHEQEAFEMVKSDSDVAAVVELASPERKSARRERAPESYSPPIHAAKSVSAPGGGPCIRRAGCTCVDCSEMASIFRQPTKAKSPKQLTTTSPDKGATHDKKIILVPTVEADMGTSCVALAVSNMQGSGSDETEEMLILGEKESIIETNNEDVVDVPVGNQKQSVVFQTAMDEECITPQDKTDDLVPSCALVLEKAGALNNQQHDCSPVQEESLEADVQPEESADCTPAKAPGAVLSNSPDANAAALCDLMSMDDDTTSMLDISVMEDPTAQSPASTQKPAAISAPEEEKKEKVQWDIVNDWDECAVKPQEVVADPAPAPAPAAGRSRAMYTLDDVERISRYQKEAVEDKLEREKAALTAIIAHKDEEYSATKAKLESDFQRARTAVQEADSMIEQMKTMLESNGKHLQKLSKESTENKAYADELEVAFNELHERYTKLKEYYNTSDKKNIELSHALQQTNEILRQSQDQVAAKDERYKLLEQKKETELFARDEKHKEAEKNLLDLIDEAKRQCEIDRQSVVQAQKDVVDKESALVQANVRVNLGRQEVMEQRSEMDKYKFNYHTEHQKCLTQEKRLKELEASVEKQNAELHELRLKVSQSVPASDQETRVIKAQLQKALIDKNAIKAQLEAKELDNKQLSAMCDELLQSMEASKS